MIPVVKYGYSRLLPCAQTNGKLISYGISLRITLRRQDTVDLWTSEHPLAQPVSYGKNFIILCSEKWLPGSGNYTFAGPADRRVRFVTISIYHKVNLWHR